jgi:hypothetical protein
MGVAPTNAMQRREQQRDLAIRASNSSKSRDTVATIGVVFDAGYFANGGSWPSAARNLLFKEWTKLKSLGSDLGVLIIEARLPGTPSSAPGIYCSLVGHFENGNGAHLMGRPVLLKVSSHGGYETTATLLPSMKRQYDPAEANTVPSIGAII